MRFGLFGSAQANSANLGADAAPVRLRGCCRTGGVRPGYARRVARTLTKHCQNMRIGCAVQYWKLQDIPCSQDFLLGLEKN